MRFIFRRTVSMALMNQWEELIQIASSIELTREEDTIIWQYNSNGKYSVQTLYAIINDRGVKQVYTLVVWKIHVPPRIHILLWLLANNKILTRDNLAKRGEVDDGSCLYCMESESVDHLFLSVVNHVIFGRQLLKSWGLRLLGTLNPWQNGALKVRNTMLLMFFMMSCVVEFCGKREIIFIFSEKDGEVYM
jgi:hypothetical protein